MGLGVQNLDTKGVPAASDEFVSAAGAETLVVKRCCWDKRKDMRIDLFTALDFGSLCLNLTCSVALSCTLHTVASLPVSFQKHRVKGQQEKNTEGKTLNLMQKIKR